MLSFVSFLDFIYKGGKHLIYKAHKFSLATEKLLRVQGQEEMLLYKLGKDWETQGVW